MIESKYFQMAVAAAKRGTDTWTNPQVGAVIVKDQQVLAVGYHHQYGQHHAEIDALAQLDDISQAKGATMYVTLEPCSHYGKTPPCAKRLAEVGIARVIIGQLDPNPIVSGKGVAILKSHGIKVDILGDSLGLNQAYNYFYQHQRPLITLKYAMSLDGKINGAQRKRTLLTETAAQQDAQQLRRQQQAILVGEHTLTIDDPHLTVRTSLPMAFPPIRAAVVHHVDEVDVNSHLFDQSAPTWFFSETMSARKLPENVHVFVKANWTPAAVVQSLANHGIQSLLVEGGSHLQADFIAADLVDELVVYVAPTILGGDGLPAAVGQALSGPTRFETPTISMLGPDIRIQTKKV
ncbi:riboflavin biosynthesis protein RibD [Secundilactobacillus pentosiphilus]|uniref:Riboflavin biosynthesis protein RibD n=1 Tax=Secundilactobacillus pentosiphilus TaxID=1714682 RepID=A0A1Z5IT81_9LACO|nr:bifunctional diaminohydroxyphosphoribosylaminopyrimidine deaminase/5-amino-6-(5-phosphoribosylamino)uracil reductase RibD [Secundilactobacillus pentosiphilus]GAX04973.1 riboflavin biosynthesis protein RibD [Secundilactobacillus pentosiphilus]